MNISSVCIQRFAGYINPNCIVDVWLVDLHPTIATSLTNSSFFFLFNFPLETSPETIQRSSVVCFGSQVRFVCIMCLGVIHVACTTLLIRRPNMMAFRVGGALESLQEQYFLLNLCFSMVTFDLQAQVHVHFTIQNMTGWLLFDVLRP